MYNFVFSNAISVRHLMYIIHCDCSQFSLAKLGSLLIKTLSKPVAKRIKSQMIKNDITRDGLIWVGQKTHALTTRMEIWSSGYTVRNINKLEETEGEFMIINRRCNLHTTSWILPVPFINTNKIMFVQQIQPYPGAQIS